MRIRKYKTNEKLFEKRAWSGEFFTSEGRILELKFFKKNPWKS